jgi:acyl-CoA thioesterase-1
MSIAVALRVSALGTLALMIGCSAPDGNTEPAPRLRAEGEPGPQAAAPVVLFLVTAGFGLDPDDAYPALIARKIRDAGLPYQVVNAGVSGESSAGALRRLDWLLRQPFEVMVLETGANDMLRGADPDETRRNIRAIIERVRAERPDARIVLAGMMAMPNLGEAYVRRFQSIYPEIAREERLPLVPFLLEGVAAEPALNLQDGVHPNERGQERVAETVWQTLEPVLRAPRAPAGR